MINGFLNLILLPYYLAHEMLHLLPMIASRSRGQAKAMIAWSPSLGLIFQVVRFQTESCKAIDSLICLAPLILNVSAFIEAWHCMSSGYYTWAIYWLIVCIKCGVSKQDLKQFVELWRAN